MKTTGKGYKLNYFELLFSHGGGSHGYTNHESHSQTLILLIRPQYSFYGLSQTSSFVSQQFGLKSDLVWLVFLQWSLMFVYIFMRPLLYSESDLEKSQKNQHNWFRIATRKMQFRPSKGHHSTSLVVIFLPVSLPCLCHISESSSRLQSLSCTYARRERKGPIFTERLHFRYYFQLEGLISLPFLTPTRFLGARPCLPLTSSWTQFFLVVTWLFCCRNFSFQPHPAWQPL